MGVPPQVAPSPMGAPPPAPGMGQPGMGQPGMGQGQPRQFNAAAAFQALRRNPANAGVPDEALLQYVRQFQQTMTAGQITPYEQAELAQRNQISPYQQAELARSKQQDEEHKREFGITSGLESRRIKDAEQHQDVILMQDQGNNNHTYRYNIATGKSTEMDTQTPYAPSGASTKMGTSGQPRSAPAMAVKKFMEEHPDATADDIANFGAAYGAKVKTARDFATGQQGNGVKAIQTVLQHFDVVQQAADALGSTDIQVQNRARQFWQKQFGSPLPTNFSALKQIVGSEIIKAVVAGGGGVTERAEAETYLSNWNSPAQTAGVLGEYEQLMAGQLNGLRMQYESGSGLDDFDQRLRLNDKTLDVMKKHGYVSGGSGGTGGAAAGGGGSAPAAPSNKPTISNW
jgi:hypothetical protein